MTRETRSTTAAEPERASGLDRLRTLYHRIPLGRRLVCALVLTTVVAVAAFVAGLSVPGAVVGTLVLLTVLAALMRSTDAFVTVMVCVLWLAVAVPLFQIPLTGEPVTLLIPPLPLLVVLAAGRAREFPVWHTAALSLTAGLIAGFSLALVGLVVESFSASWGIALLYTAAGACLLWRLSASRQILRDSEANRREAAKAMPVSRRTGRGDRSDASGGPDAEGRAQPMRGRADTGPRPGRPAAGEAHDEEPVPVDQALAELEDMIGLDPVKQQVRGIAASIEAARLRADAGFPVERPLRHLVFSGPPGTGKTSVARTLATIFHSFGLLPTSRVVEAQRADLVGEYLGATAIKTNELVDRALGGVLFVDEAYSLVNEGDGQSDRFGNEAVQTLLKRAEDDRDQLVVVLAGYEKEMDAFLASNPGLASRFATRISFPSYSADELFRIAESLVRQRGDTLEAGAAQALRRRFDQVVQREVVDELGNGRFARSVVEKAAQARDVRVVTAGVDGGEPAPRPEAEDLITVRAVDVEAAHRELTSRLPGFGEAPGIEEALAELDAMIGLEPVKEQVRSIVAQLRVAKLREEQGLLNQAPMRHFVFSGPPGTGKTTVARVLGRVFAALGLLGRAEVVEAQRADLVGEHLGATAVKTNRLVDRALGGVLFVDEAYSLVNPGYSGGDAFGAEAIQTLLKRAEDDRSRLVVVLAGYPAEMERFLASNAGLSSRFNVRVRFPSYAPAELTEIAEAVAARTGDTFDDTAREDLRSIFAHVCEAGWIDELGNGRFARSLFEKACSHRDLRVSQEVGEAATAADLTVVTSADVRRAYAEATQQA
ncbi:SpoVK/Ycf46/Vps4 family AAA+-type ATPase [Nocardiopsis arvandica]|uniref:SpoVK/Ycf46/Vps4 family AAA+-type ATPase n=1 Tax=Nocardiopsis sinuspersici TaxID=501010 RepID=A0A7Y9X8V4_9ACTN|nr:AAA family ATPase [Nocardiopsis sinuspersici]NYH51179.1 SpoVK/Ycf46/Vps4 family AAA+-type ATPase [Nocardiopsis sinuspersici]